MYETWSWRWERRILHYGEGKTISLTFPVPPPDCVCDRERAFAEYSRDMAEMRRVSDEEAETIGGGVTLRLQHASWAAYWAGAHPNPYARSEWGRLARFFEKQVYHSIERDGGQGATEGNLRWRVLS